VLYLLATVGLLASLGAGFLYLEGRRAEARLDPNTPRVYREFARRMLAGGDAASASVLKLPLAEGVTVKEAIASMESRAAARNIKVLGRVKITQGDKERPARHAEVFHFCDASTASALLEYNPDFLAYMPCSIGLYMDGGGRAWLVTMNLDLLIHGGPEIDPELKQRVLAVKEGLLDIMAAGAAGAL
jgi:uncharacterized protein (DUF302 family)